MLEQLKKWALVSSQSHDEKGLQTMLDTLKQDFAILNADHVEIVEKKILHFSKRKEAPTKILLGGHMDTVFTPLTCPVVQISENILQGAGVTDMKGGLLILLKALERFEKNPSSKQVGWEIFINHDEEIGSPVSAPFIEECAKRCDLALIFEPAFPDGTYVSSRKGSANYLLESQGKAAHVGRDFKAGKNAIIPLARLLCKLEELQNESVQINAGIIAGGVAANVVPESASATVNIRTNLKEELERAEQELQKMAAKENIVVKTLVKRFPKPFDHKTEELFNVLRKCGGEIGVEVAWRATGGVSDGNTVALAGIPCIDTMGAIGGNLHTAVEYIEIDSLEKRTQLCVHFLSELARSKR